MAEHGSTKRYRDGCRCDPCKSAKATEHAAYRARRAAGLTGKPGRVAIPLAEREHGSYVTYSKGCRCEPCTLANSEYGRREKVAALRGALTGAINSWAHASPDVIGYEHGRAQGIAEALAIVRGTSLSEEWQAGLNRYHRPVSA